MTNIVKGTAKESIEKLTINQLQSIVDVIENKGFITDECTTKDGYVPFTKVMIKHGSTLLIKRLQQEVGYEYPLSSTGFYHNNYGEVLAIFSCEFFKDTLDFKQKALIPFIEKAINSMYL
ncbi:hypothetical protein COJ16_10160 [Bacillus cereus]|uniref:hypothetical protein n=1 Tax=Bacillus cereus TaxID=1396 RepID=UPI000BF9C0F5|nr:hypothetical protein [Bacillus cereus]PFL38157.1 hypothetical protein COJ16_10160 [Bacillus cereus]PGS93033.1 hypothetical protein COD00_05065 [Bacillus cereus]